MKGEDLPLADFISRYCKASTLTEDNDRLPTGASFQLREDENYLSVNWMEKLGNSREGQLKNLLIVLKKKLGIGSTAKFSIVNIAELKNYLQREYDRMVRVLHEPEELPTGEQDESHAGVHDMRPEEDLIAELISEIACESELYEVKDINIDSEK